MIDYRRSFQKPQPGNYNPMWEALLNPEERAYLEQSRDEYKETIWTLLRPEELVLPAADQEAIGMGEMQCPLCEPGPRYDMPVCYPEYKGETTGILYARETPCPCRRLRAFYPAFYATVPPQDRHANLHTLKPSPQSKLALLYQAEMITGLRENASQNYALYGPAGTSKTTFAVGLYREALWKSPRSTWRVNVKDLLDDHVAYSNDRIARKPAVTSRSLSLAQSPHLFIEEIDKVAYTDFKTNTLFGLVNAVYEAKGQLVFTSNKTAADLIAMFHSETGEALARRISEMCVPLDFFSAPKS